MLPLRTNPSNSAFWPGLRASAGAELGMPQYKAGPRQCKQLSKTGHYVEANQLSSANSRYKSMTFMAGCGHRPWTVPKLDVTGSSTVSRSKINNLRIPF